MKLLIIVLICCFVTAIKTVAGETPTTHEGAKSAPTEEALIMPHGIIMPLGRIALVRKDRQHCAVKFTEAWNGKTDQDWFAKYEAYYQGDGSGDFSKKNVHIKKEELAIRRIVGISKLLSFPVGPQNLEVKCGPIRLLWSGNGSLYFFSLGQQQGDYGIELAPTKWKDISQVNVFNQGIKWYKYDGRRKEIYIPIDQVWEDKEDKK